MVVKQISLNLKKIIVADNPLLLIARCQVDGSEIGVHEVNRTPVETFYFSCAWIEITYLERYQYICLFQPVQILFAADTPGWIVSEKLRTLADKIDESVDARHKGKKPSEEELLIGMMMHWFS